MWRERVEQRRGRRTDKRLGRVRTTFGVRAVTMMRRTAAWRGGSSSPRRRSSIGTSMPGAFMPFALEKAVVSRSTSRHGSWRVT